MNVAYIEFLDWSASIGGEHLYAKLIFSKDKKDNRIELQNKMSQEMANYLNKKDGTNEYCAYKEGDLTLRFNNVKEALMEARKTCKKLFPEVDIILKGSPGWASVTEVLWAKDKTVKTKINKWYKEAVKLNYYSGKNDDRMEEIDDQFTEIIRS
jgi:hypothetical protein